jgi:predicted transcriptional regulator
MEIAATILQIAQDGAMKTRIMYNAFLSFPQLNEYLAFLKDNGLLEYDSDTNLYHTTEKGKRFSNNYKELDHMLNPKEIKTRRKA